MEARTSAVPLASIVIPAHNEERAIGRLLHRLLEQAGPSEFEIVVVCNGCTDDTAAVARSFGPSVRVVELDEASKRNAIRVGDTEAKALPRVYVDADVEIATQDIRDLVRPLRRRAVLATAPERDLRYDNVSPLVRGYYGVWTRLPQVRSGLFGRGVVAVSADGIDRVRALPPFMSDDLAMSEAFGDTERLVVSKAHVVIWPPRTIRSLIRRRIRMNTGNAELDRLSARSGAAKTSASDLIGMVRERPRLIIRVPIFVGVAIVSRISAERRIRRGDFTTWLRDESSREPAPPSP